MAIHRTHTFALGCNCFIQGLTEEQADHVIRQFSSVLHPHAIDDFWDGYYKSTMAHDMQAAQSDSMFVPSYAEQQCSSIAFNQAPDGMWR